MTDFSKILPKGEAHAMPAGELMAILGLNDTRELRKYIAHARMKGQIICTAPGGGYFMPETKSELSRWARTTTRRAASTFATLKTARAVLNETDGQMNIDDMEK